MLRFLSLIFITILVISCGKDDGPISEVALISIAPNSVIFNDTEEAKVSLRLVSGESAAWQLSSIPTWLNVDINSGTLNNGSLQELTLTASTEGFPQGKLSGALEIIWGVNERRSINVTVCVNEVIELTILDTEVTLNEFSGYSANVRLTNTGEGVINFTAIPQSSDIFVSTSGTEMIEPGNEYFLYINFAIPPGQAAGILERSVIIQSNDPRGDQTINLTIEVLETASVFLDFFDTNFGTEKNEIKMTLVNDGNTPTEWSLINESIYQSVIVSPSSGVLNLNESIELVFSLDRTGIENGFYSEDFTLEVEGFALDLVIVDYQVYEEDKLLLLGSVIDGEYDGNNNIMYVVQEFPNLLVSYKSLDESSSFLDLSFAPIELSLSPNGEFAIISGFDDFVMVSLESLSASGVISTSGAIKAISIDNNGNGYVFSNNSMETYTSSGTIEELDLGQNNDVIKARIHPGGEMIYAIQGNSTQALVINISGATNTLDNVIDLTADPNSDFWFSDNGDKLISQTANVYDLNTSTFDLTFNKRINIPNDFLDLYYSSALNMFSGVLGYVDNYDPNFFSLDGGYRFRASDCSQEENIGDISFLVNDFGEPFIEPGVARYVGINESTAEYIVVSSTYDNSSNAPWGISKLTIQ